MDISRRYCSNRVLSAHAFVIRVRHRPCCPVPWYALVPVQVLPPSRGRLGGSARIERVRTPAAPGGKGWHRRRAVRRSAPPPASISTPPRVRNPRQGRYPPVAADPIIL